MGIGICVGAGRLDGIIGLISSGAGWAMGLDRKNGPALAAGGLGSRAWRGRGQVWRIAGRILPEGTWDIQRGVCWRGDLPCYCTMVTRAKKWGRKEMVKPIIALFYPSGSCLGLRT